MKAISLVLILTVGVFAETTQKYNNRNPKDIFKAAIRAASTDHHKVESESDMGMMLTCTRPGSVAGSCTIIIDDDSTMHVKCDGGLGRKKDENRLIDGINRQLESK